MPDPHHQEVRMSGTTVFAPTSEQLALLRRLTQERGTTLPWPRTRAQADRAIHRLIGWKGATR
jgi:hypothetical protein